MSNPVVNRIDWKEAIKDYYSPDSNFRFMEHKYKVSIRTIQKVIRIIMEEQFKDEGSLIMENLERFNQEVDDTQDKFFGYLNDR